MAKKKKTLKSNFRRPTLKSALRYIKANKEAEMDGTISQQRELKLIESYRVVYESYENTGKDKEKFKKKKKKAKLSKRPDRGNYIGESVFKAKRYLKSVEKYSAQKRKQPNIAIRIKEAQRVIRKAEMRNLKKREGRASDREEKSLVKDLSVIKWEEVTGPNGEVIRFRLDPYKAGAKQGGLKRRVRTKSEPGPGDVVLDSTGPTDGSGDGIRAWRITENRRRKYDVTKRMVDTYKTSILYQVRRMAAGQISLQQLHDFIGDELKKPSALVASSKEYKQSMRRKAASKPRSMRRRRKNRF